MQSSHHQGFSDQFSGSGPVTLDPSLRVLAALVQLPGPARRSGPCFPVVVPAGMDQMRPGGLF